MYRDRETAIRSKRSEGAKGWKKSQIKEIELVELPKLAGSEKQVAWAESIRENALNLTLEIKQTLSGGKKWGGVVSPKALQYVEDLERDILSWQKADTFINNKKIGQRNGISYAISNKIDQERKAGKKL